MSETCNNFSFDDCSVSFIFSDDGNPNLEMLDALRGPYFTPSVDESGNLSWTNNGNLPNPETVNIKGSQGDPLKITGVTDSVGNLPTDADQGDVWLVGSGSTTYDGYVWLGSWTSIGACTVVPQGTPGTPGAPGVSPALSIGSVTTGAAGTNAVVTMTGTTAFPVLNFTIPRGANGTSGTVIQIVSGTGSAAVVANTSTKITVSFDNIPTNVSYVCEVVETVKGATSAQNVISCVRTSRATALSTYYVTSTSNQTVTVSARRIYRY